MNECCESARRTAATYKRGENAAVAERDRLRMFRSKVAVAFAQSTTYEQFGRLVVDLLKEEDDQ